jgi:hypothetical protein
MNIKRIINFKYLTLNKSMNSYVKKLNNRIKSKSKFYKRNSMRCLNLRKKIENKLKNFVHRKLKIMKSTLNSWKIKMTNYASKERSKVNRIYNNKQQLID